MLKKFICIFGNVYFVLPLVCCFLFACQKNQTAKAYDGETLFNGIFFGQGEVAEKIPEIKSEINKFVSSEEDRNQLKKVQAEIITKIHGSYPDFFKEFGISMQSGNQLIIQKGLKNAGDIFMKVVTNMVDSAEVFLEQNNQDKFIKEINETVDVKSLLDVNIPFDKSNYKKQISTLKSLTNGSSSPSQLICVAVVVVLALAVAAAAVVVVFLMWPIRTNNDDARLKQELVIEQIAKNLVFVQNK